MRSDPGPGRGARTGQALSLRTLHSLGVAFPSPKFSPDALSLGLDWSGLQPGRPGSPGSETSLWSRPRGGTARRCGFGETTSLPLLRAPASGCRPQPTFRTHGNLTEAGHPMRPEHPVCTLNPGGGRGREHQAICSLPLLPPPPRPLPSARLTAAAPPPGMSDSVKDKFSVTFSIVGMFASHAAGSLSVFFCAEITPTVIRCVAGLPEVGGGLPRPRGQGRPIWQGARGPATSPGLWSQLPDGRPALPPGAWRVRGELEPGSHLGSWRNGVQGARGARAAAGPAQRAKSGLTEFMPTLSTLPEPSEEPGRGRGRGGRKGLASAGLRSQCHASRGRP